MLIEYVWGISFDINPRWHHCVPGLGPGLNLRPPGGRYGHISTNGFASCIPVSSSVGNGSAGSIRSR